MGNPLLEIKNLIVKYHNKEILKIQNFVLYPTERVGIMGENGSGKSTFLRVIMQLEKNWQGELFFEGKKISPFSLDGIRSEAAMVFPQPILFNTTIIENLKIPLRIRKIKKEAEVYERVNQWLEFFELKEISCKKPHQLSSGEARRVSLAQALVLEPKLLLLDEPFTHLDSAIKQKLFNKLKELWEKKNIAMIFVSHHLEELKEICDRIIFLSEGKIVGEKVLRQ